MREEQTDVLHGQLSRTPLFKGMPGDNIHELVRIAVVKKVVRGTSVFAEGDNANGFYVVASGRVKIFKLSLDGKEQIIHLLGPGEPFGEVPVFQGTVFPAHAECLEDSELIFLPRTAFIGLVKNNPSLALNMLAVLSQRLRAMTRMIEDLALKEAPARFAAYLLYESDRTGKSDAVQLDIAKSLLASLIGATPETLSRILAKLTREGFIRAEGSRIVILDRTSLELLASEGKL